MVAPTSGGAQHAAQELADGLCGSEIEEFSYGFRLVLRYDSVWFSFGMFFFFGPDVIHFWGSKAAMTDTVCLQGDVSATCRADIDYQIRIVWYACDVCKPQRLWKSEKWLRGPPGLLLVITGHYRWLPVMSNGRMQWFSKVQPKLQIQAAQDWFPSSLFIIWNFGR